jgi:hypothetical protein
MADYIYCNTSAESRFTVKNPIEVAGVFSELGFDETYCDSSNNTVFTQSFGPNDKAVAAAADADCANMNEVMNNVFAQLSAAGDNASVDDIQFNTPEHQMTTRETNKAVFGIDFGSDE